MGVTCRLVGLLLGCAIAGTLSSCSTPKVVQCQHLAKVVDQIRPIADQFQQESKRFEVASKAAGAKRDLVAFKAAASQSAVTFKRLVNQLNQLITQIESMTLPDPTLTRLRNRYAKNATATSEAFTGMGTILQRISTIQASPQGATALQKAAKDLSQTATQMNQYVQEEQDVVTELNEYCEL